MLIYLIVYKRLLWLILVNLFSKMASAFKNGAIYLIYFVCTFFKFEGSWCDRWKSFVFRQKMPKPKPIRRVGFVIYTRCPISDRVLQRHDSDCADSRLIRFLKNFSLLERVLVEVLANTVAEFNQRNSNLVGDFTIRSHLFLVYRKSYTAAYDFDSWLDRFPDHLKTGQNSKHPVHIDNSNNTRQKFNISHKIKHCLDRLRNENCTTPPLDEFCAFRKHRCHSLALTPICGVHYHGDDEDSCSRVVAPFSKSKQKFLSDCKYVTIEGLDHIHLLEVGLHAALRANCDFVIVLNPRAIGLDSNIIQTTLNILMNDTCGQSINAVLGYTTNCDPHVPDQSRSNQLSLGGSDSNSGLYLIGLRGGRSLTLGAKNLCRGVEWSTSSTGSNLWLNLQRYLSTWSVCSLVKRLEEITKPEDVLVAETCLGLESRHILDDSISLIIPIGPGHPDDDLDSDEDLELVDFHRSKSLTASLDLALHNASGTRPIEIIIIHSTSSDSANTTLDGSLRSPTLDKLCSAELRPMIKVKKCFYHDGRHSFVPDSDGNRSVTSEYPKRGELIRFAVERFARGSILLFMEPGTLLPKHWDTSVYLNLQNPTIGMGCFAFRLNLPHKYIYRKSIWWSMAAVLANYCVNKQTLYSGLPIVGQPCFIYAHYLKQIGGYPKSSRWLHTIDLAVQVQRLLGSVQVTKSDSGTAAIPTDFALKHGAYRSAFYNLLVTGARLTGASESELNYAKLKFHKINHSNHPLPLLQPYYLDGY